MSVSRKDSDPILCTTLKWDPKELEHCFLCIHCVYISLFSKDKYWNREISFVLLLSARAPNGLQPEACLRSHELPDRSDRPLSSHYNIEQEVFIVELSNTSLQRVVEM